MPELKPPPGEERVTSYNGREFSCFTRGPDPPGYPERETLDEFTLAPGKPPAECYYAREYGERRKAFLDFSLANPAPKNLKAAYYELPRIAAGRAAHEGILEGALDYIAARKDCADFLVHAFIRILMQFPDSRSISPRLRARIEEVLLGFKYWPDEPGKDSLCTWTENHQILYASAAYILGRAWPRKTFTNSGLKGTELAGRALPRIERWLSLRFRTGFSEWLSNVYYDEDLTALLSLVDFAGLELGAAGTKLARKAHAVADLLLLDLALNSFKGIFGASHGRSYEVHKKESGLESMSDTSKLAFGRGRWARHDNMSAVCLALSPSYSPPETIIAAAQDEPDEAEIRQRMGIKVDEAARWGLGYGNFENNMVFLSLEAYNHPKTIRTTFRMLDAYGWWDNEYFAPFKPYRKALSVLRHLGLLPLLAKAFDADVNRNAREEVDLYTYKTPDYMLSCAQDYRAWRGGDQHSIWQATLGPGAVCFTTHPGNRGGHSPDYWTGSGSLPRAAQYRNLLIVFYNIDTRPGLYRTNRLPFTHAWLPVERFDEFIEEGGWLFARKDSGYLALKASLPTRFVREDGGSGQPNEAIAEGRRTVWICRLGREAVEGSFADFRRAIVSANLTLSSKCASFDDPWLGRVEFGIRGPLKVAGKEIPLKDYPRYDSPWTKAEFPAEQVEIVAGGKKHTITFRSEALH